jgi:hypothetical protein
MTGEERYKSEEVPLEFEHKGLQYKGTARPLATSCREGVCFELDVVINDTEMGTIYCGNDMRWTLKGCTDQELVNKIGEEILLWYE